MKMTDVLRSIADMLDQKIGQKPGSLSPVKTAEPDLEDNPVMVPPLQAKLEILKKSEGLPNVYDDDAGEDEGSDELEVIKKNAGLSAAQHEASEDNDVLG